MSTERTKLYIPKQIHAGFQKRGDTYNGKLSYIIYTDDKGKKRKETSWEGWRDKKIDAEDYSNSPLTGFVLHKDVKRYNWDHFSSKRTLIRVFDPRGMEFEITTDNLLFILQHTDCVKRELTGEFVYAWLGPELILLPKDTEEYRMSSDFTDLQAQKVSAKDLVAGCSYKTKQMVDLVYVGRHLWYDWRGAYSRDGDRLGKKYHIFTQDDGKNFIIKSSADFLAAKNSDEIVANFADIVDKFNKNSHSSKIVKFELVPATFCTKKDPQYGDYNHGYLKNSYYFMQDGVDKIVTLRAQGNPATIDGKSVINGYMYHKGLILDTKTQTFSAQQKSDWIYKSSAQTNYWSHSYVHFIEDEMNKLGFCDLYVTLENGKRTKVKDFHAL